MSMGPRRGPSPGGAGGAGAAGAAGTAGGAGGHGTLRRRPGTPKLSLDGSLPSLDSLDALGALAERRAGRPNRAGSLALPGTNERALLDLLLAQQQQRHQQQEQQLQSQQLHQLQQHQQQTAQTGRLERGASVAGAAAGPAPKLPQPPARRPRRHSVSHAYFPPERPAAGSAPAPAYTPASAPGQPPQPTAAAVAAVAAAASTLTATTAAATTTTTGTATSMTASAAVPQMVSSGAPPPLRGPPPVPERTRVGPPPPLPPTQRYAAVAALPQGHYAVPAAAHPQAKQLQQPALPPPFIPKHAKYPAGPEAGARAGTGTAPPSPRPPQRAPAKIPPPPLPQQPQVKQPAAGKTRPTTPASQPPPPPPPLAHARRPSLSAEPPSPTPTPPPAASATPSPPTAKMSMRQDSSVSSDSYSQNSSPSYTTKTMEAPLLPHHASKSAAHVPGRTKGGGGGGAETAGAGAAAAAAAVAGAAAAAAAAAGVANGSAALTKSISTPASLQTIVRFHHGSNMSLHHRIIRDMRRPSAHYITRGRLRFRFAQVLVNALALLAIAGGLAAYFRAYPSTVRYVNTSVATTVVPSPPENPAPGICLPVIVSFCHYHKVPYNFTMFPNYMGHFTQRDAQQELEVYDAVVDVRCYELAALFLCSVFVPKCGPTGQLVRPCRNLCVETKRRCGFFLEVFSLTLPDYLECDLFPDSPDIDMCVGYQEVLDAEIRAQKPTCPTGFQCDTRRCIPSDWRCDGHVDCEDQTDELHCHDRCEQAGMIHCGEKQCMSPSQVCDGIVHCPWGQDERNCIRLSERMGDEGHGTLELYHPEVQGFQPACLRDGQRQISPQVICSILGYASSNASLRETSDYTYTQLTRRNHQIKKSTLLKELRSCPIERHSPLEVSCHNYICGKGRHDSGRPSPRIVGGVESSPGDWPFLAALLGGPEEIFYCAGVLIADQWVLTASHCVGNFSQSEPTGWTIQLGITRRHAHSYYGQKMKVRRVVPHPLYNFGVAHDNDVALFQLKTRVKFHEHLLPVCLPPPNHELLPGTVCTVIGWGKREDKDASEYEPAVNEVQVPVLNRELCNSWLDHRDLNVTEGMICAGYPEGGKDACQGDSGGPLLCQDKKLQDRWFVGGIVSWGIKCAHPHLPGVYAYVPKYVPWIKQQMALYSD